MLSRAARAPADALPLHGRLAPTSPHEGTRRPSTEAAPAPTAFDLGRISILPAPRIQKKCAACEEEHDGKTAQAKLAGPAPEDARVTDGRRATEGGGASLSPEVRGFFEPRFGADFAAVRVHTGPEAAASARALHAEAYTIGQSIVFGDGAYAPSTLEGKRLLAHELTHTIQQRGVSGPAPSSLAVTPPDHATEVEADRAADAVVSGATPAVATQAGPAIARDETQMKKQVIPAPSTPWGRSPGPSTWGWGGLETKNLYQQCNVVELSRDDFVAWHDSLPAESRRRAPTHAKAALGATHSTLSDAKPPLIEAVQVTDGARPTFKLKPTHAEMPSITSAVTGVSEFVEDKRRFASQQTSPGDCAGGLYDLRTVLVRSGVDKLKEGEQEHCDDLRVAFDMTLGLYASIINNVAAAEREYSSAKAAEDDAKSALAVIGVTPATMMSEYVTMCAKTKTRDSKEWHTGAPPQGRRKSPMDSGCKEYVWTYDASAFPEVGTHSPFELMEPPAAPAKKP